MAKLYYEVKSELRFITTISIFIVTFVNIFFNYAKSAESSRTTFYAAPIVMVYLIAYFLMCWNRKDILNANSYLKGIHALLLLNVAVVCLWVILVANVEIIDLIGIQELSRMATALNQLFLMLIVYILPAALVFALSFPGLLIKRR